MLTILAAALCKFFVAQKASIASSIIARGTYDVVKENLNLGSLRQKLAGFFPDDAQTETFVEQLCRKEAVNIEKPYRDVEDLYENTISKEYTPDIYRAIESWAKENETAINNVAQMHFTNQGGFNIGTQSAGKDIYNIQGDFKPKK
jgi:hypothetical protein